jgi:hypothetical protein
LDQVADSYTEMVELALYPILALFALYGFLRLIAYVVGPRCDACHSHLRPRWLAPLLIRIYKGFTLPLYEAVGILFLLAYPFWGIS